ncbi:GPN-loop GTPase 1 [Diplonema papillatum]|nr:GPN-loop GTPase 1 [Diplonema papillatum]|eukprot:gene14133-21655_t
MSAPSAEESAAGAPVLDRTAPVEGSSDAAEKTKRKKHVGPTHIENKDPRKLPTVVLVIGMAGSGKTRFMHRMNLEMHEKKIPSFFINLDPAVIDVPYGVNIDIRDTVSHKEVMKQYNLGPNGAIVTSLNLFATRFDQVLGYIEQRQHELEYVFIDTPGQIEVFTWSASGQIIMETLASTFPTVATYVVDTPKSSNPSTFMSNMMYACGILYRTQLPLLLCFNKTDVTDHSTAVTWMKDADVFRDAMVTEEAYSAQLTKSMAFVLQEFYANLRYCGMSAATGQGVDGCLAQLKECKADYCDVFYPELKSKMLKKRQADATKEEDNHRRFASDLESSQGFKIVAGRGADAQPGDDEHDQEEEQDSDLEYDEYTNRERTLEDDPLDDGSPPPHLID